MKKGSRCIPQTINLSNPGTCVRPRPVQKLVSGDATESCPTSGGSHWTPRPVSVKLCSRQQLRRTCPPKLCDCPQKSGPKSATGKFGRAVLFVVKVFAAAGLVHWTNSEGFWADGDRTEDLYCRILATFEPTRGPPHLEGIRYTMIQRYNRAVFDLTSAIVDLPTRMRKRIRDTLASGEGSEENKTARSEQEEADDQD